MTALARKRDNVLKSQNEGYRTAEMPTAARLFEDLAAVDSSNVEYTELDWNELNTEIRLLAEAWLIYTGRHSLF